MKYNKLYGLFIVLAGLFLVTSCTDDDFGSDVENQQQKKIELSGEIEQVYVTRVNDEGFCDKDEIGVYITDYNGSTPTELKNSGNRADNVRHIYNEAENKWVPVQDIYWKDKNTNIDVYGYYPFAEPNDVNNYAFEVLQNQADVSGNIGGYEASDFLWGKAENIAPTDKVIKLKFKHKMASVRVTLQEGSGFSAGEWAALDKSVVLLNTVRKASIDLSKGNVTAAGEVSEVGIIPMNSGADYRAIVVPQTIKAGTVLFGISVGGVPYKYKKSESFVYNQSKQHNFTITINKKEGGGLEFIVGNESITAWENDDISHDATARAYVVIDCPEYGQLKQSIMAAKKDYSTLKNLKITGNINSEDFYFMRDEMSELQALNLKDVRVENDEIPSDAFANRNSIMRLVLPDKLQVIGDRAFFLCTNLIGSLIIPEGVKIIKNSAFYNCNSLTGTLTLPSTLETIEYASFYNCGFSGKLILPESLKEIGSSAFYFCSNFTGDLHLPSNLEVIGEGAFLNCIGFSGSIKIPEKVKHIEANAFCFDGQRGWYQGNFTGTLTLPKGLTTIGPNAFKGASLRGELNLPNELVIIPDHAFDGCDFSGKLSIPESVAVIGSYSFAFNWRLMGEVVIPKGVQSIGSNAFESCRSLESIVFEDGIETIGREAFKDCFGINRIVCKSATPPSVLPGAFDGVAKDNFTLEVPESSIHLYKSEPGWKDFKRIAAYKNFVIRPSMATAINTSVTRKLILNADGPWTVESKPDWVSLDKSSGNMKTEINLTFSEMPRGNGNREGEIVFKLTDKEFRTRCLVSQYDYNYDEDQIITLNQSSVGKGVNIMILGDGYSAKDISEGKYMADVEEAMGHFFAIEPYATYKNYFNVYTGIAVSPESGIGSINTIVNNRFNTSFKGGVALSGRNGESDFKDIFKYACKAPTITNDNLGESLVIMIANTSDYGGICYMYDDGSAIAYCPKSNYGYPFDFRGVVQHEAGGHGFGKLADEYIYHNEFIDNCPCTCCQHDEGILWGKNHGWYANISLTGKANEVNWSHLIFHPKYNQTVDVYEGGFFHARGVYRSEHNSCMNNDIPYYSTVSREAMVKRIKSIAGETYSFEDFVKNDKLDVIQTTRANVSFNPGFVNMNSIHHAPVILKDRPQIR